jgi:hypothetical protein
VFLTLGAYAVDLHILLTYDWRSIFPTSYYSHFMLVFSSSCLLLYEDHRILVQTLDGTLFLICNDSAGWWIFTLFCVNGPTGRLQKTITRKEFLSCKKVRIWKRALGTHLKVLSSIYVEILSKTTTTVVRIYDIIRPRFERSRRQ